MLLVDTLDNPKLDQPFYYVIPDSRDREGGHTTYVVCVVSSQQQTFKVVLLVVVVVVVVVVVQPLVSEYLSVLFVSKEEANIVAMPPGSEDDFQHK